MKKISNKQIIRYGLVFIIVFILLSAGLSYFTNSKDPITISFKRMYPASIVGTRVVSIAETEEFMNSASKMDPTADSSKTYEIFINKIKSEALLNKLGIKVNSVDISDEKDFYMKGNESALN